MTQGETINDDDTPPTEGRTPPLLLDMIATGEQVRAQGVRWDADEQTGRTPPAAPAPPEEGRAARGNDPEPTVTRAMARELTRLYREELDQRMAEAMAEARKRFRKAADDALLEALRRWRTAPEPSQEPPPNEQPTDRR